MSELRLYCPHLVEGSFALPADESHHAITVLRVKPGQEVALMDGVGCEAVGKVESVHAGRLTVNVGALRRRPFDLSRRLTLAVAMPKAHRQGYLIEKCTELGVAAIWPIIADHSVTRPKKAAVEKWTRRAVEAAKQSRRAWIPEINEPQSFGEAIGRADKFDAAGLADAGAAAIGMTAFLVGVPEDRSLIVAVGPEGGWSDAERKSALEVGAVPIALGPTILRTETAAIAVCAAVAMCSPNRGTSDD